MFESGFWQPGKLKGVPIRFHWSVILGALLFGGLRFRPLFWISFFFLILAHELGHAYLVHRTGHRVLAVDVTGFGGLCRWTGHASAYQRSLIAWGGVWAQGVILLITVGLLAASVPLPGDVVATFISTNIWLIVLNLLPIPPLDGAQAWKLFGLLRSSGEGPWWRLKNWAYRRRQRRVERPRARTRTRRHHEENPGHGQQRPGGNGSPDLSNQAKAELAALFEQVSKEAQKARKK